MTVMPHPLEPLGADELERAVACVRSARGLAEGVRFVFVELREPDKERLAAWRDGGPVPPREAALVVLAGGETHEAVVALEDDSLVAWEHVPGVQAAITGDEYAESEIAVKADAGFRRALELRGIHDVELVMVDSWSVGLFEEPGRRVARALSWLRSDLTGDNGYARPIGGLIALVDLEHDAGRAHRRSRCAARARCARRLPRRRRAPLPRPTCGRSRSRSPRARASRWTAMR